MKKLSIAVPVVVAMAVLSFCSTALAQCCGGGAKDAATPTASPEPPPAWWAITLLDQGGKKVGLKGHAGKVVVLEWINWGCPFAKRHLQAGTMKKLAEKYADKGVVWIGVNSTKSDNVEINKKAHSKYKLPYPVLDDHAGRLGRAFGAKTTPHMIVLSKEHKVAYDGAIDDDPRGAKLKDGSVTNYVDLALTELLAGKKVSKSKTRPYGCSVKYAPAPPPSAKGPKARPFTLTGHDGKDVSLEKLLAAGKIVVLEWFNPDCPVSRRHYTAAKTMVDLAKKYGDKGVVWLAVNSTHYWTPAKNKAFADKHGLPYAVLDDHEGKVGRMYGAKTTPDMRIITADGTIVYSGAIDDDPGGRKLKAGEAKNHVDAILGQLVAGKDVAPTQTRPYGCSVKYAKK